MQQDCDTGMIAICALRHCVGRHTYIPSLVTDWIKRHWQSFSENDKSVMLKDLQQYIDSGRSLGDDCDARLWLAFRNWILEQNHVKKNG